MCVVRRVSRAPRSSAARSSPSMYPFPIYSEARATRLCARLAPCISLRTCTFAASASMQGSPRSRKPPSTTLASFSDGPAAEAVVPLSALRDVSWRVRRSDRSEWERRARTPARIGQPTRGKSASPRLWLPCAKGRERMEQPT
eukprot:scaffold226176_cov33-Tisochrysis_lutea.AAC.1